VRRWFRSEGEGGNQRSAILGCGLRSLDSRPRLRWRQALCGNDGEYPHPSQADLRPSPLPSFGTPSLTLPQGGRGLFFTGVEVVGEEAAFYFGIHEGDS